VLRDHRSGFETFIDIKDIRFVSRLSTFFSAFAIEATIRLFATLARRFYEFQEMLVEQKG